MILALLLIGSLAAVTGATTIHPGLGVLMFGLLCLACAVDLNRPAR